MTRAAFYIRVSSARQVEAGFSLAEQEQRCRRFIEGKGWELDDRHGYIERGVSGGKASRPALDAMKAAAAAGEFEKLVGGDMDRVGRSATDTIELLKELEAAGVEPLDAYGRSYAATDPGSLMTRGVIALAAEYERGMLAERVRRSVPGKRARGSYNGGPRPYGYEFVQDGGLVAVEREAVVIRRIFSEYNAGKPLRAIARALNEEGVAGAKGGAWTQARVADRLDNALYAGFVGGGEQGRHEPLVSAGLWAHTRDLRNATAQRRGKGADGRTKGGRSSTALLLGDGMLRCSCGASFYPRRDSRTKRGSYRCRGRDERVSDCDMPALPGTKIDAAVRSYIANHVFSPGMASSDLETQAKAAAPDAAKQASAAEREASALQAKLERGRDMMLSDDPPFMPSEWQAHRAKVEAQITAAKKRATDARALAEDLTQPSSGLLAAVEAIRKAAVAEAADGETLARQRNAIGRIIERFDVAAFPAAAGRKLAPGERELVLAQDAATADIIEPELEFEHKPRGRARLTVSLVPIPRGDVPLAGLADLRAGQNVRNGLPWR